MDNATNLRLKIVDDVFNRYKCFNVDMATQMKNEGTRMILANLQRNKKEY